MVLQNVHYNGNKKIDEFIQDMQSKIKNKNDIIFEWISYNQFDNIEEISKGDFAAVYSAIWKNGPLCYNFNKKEYARSPDKKVTLKCLHTSNSENIINELLNEVWNFINLRLICFF